MNVREFRQIQRTHEHGSFGAFEYAFTKFESLENVEPAIVYSNNHQYEFLINDVNRTALYKKCVMRKGKIFYIFKCFLFCVCIFYFYFFYFYFQIIVAQCIIMISAIVLLPSILQCELCVPFFHVTMDTS